MPTSVYFIRPIGQAGPVKIGCSIKTKRRFAEVIMWSPIPLEIAATVPGGFAEEARISCRFKQHRSHGEWYAPAVEVVAFVELVRKTGMLPFEVIEMGSGLASYRSLRGIHSLLVAHGLNIKDVADAAGTTETAVENWISVEVGAGAVGKAFGAFDVLGIEVCLTDLLGDPQQWPQRRARTLRIPSTEAALASRSAAE